MKRLFILQNLGNTRALLTHFPPSLIILWGTYIFPDPLGPNSYSCWILSHFCSCRFQIISLIHTAQTQIWKWHFFWISQDSIHERQLPFRSAQHGRGPPLCSTPVTRNDSAFQQPLTSPPHSQADFFLSPLSFLSTPPLSKATPEIVFLPLFLCKQPDPNVCLTSFWGRRQEQLRLSLEESASLCPCQTLVLSQVFTKQKMVSPLNGFCHPLLSIHTVFFGHARSMQKFLHHSSDLSHSRNNTKILDPLEPPGNSVECFFSFGCPAAYGIPRPVTRSKLQLRRAPQLWQCRIL